MELAKDDLQNYCWRKKRGRIRYIRNIAQNHEIIYWDCVGVTLEEFNYIMHRNWRKLQILIASISNLWIKNSYKTCLMLVT